MSRQPSSTRTAPIQLCLRIALLLALALLTAPRPAGVPAAVSGKVTPPPRLPPRSQPVTDLANMLSDPERRALSAKLTGFERLTGSQVGVLIVDRLGDTTLENYSLRVAEVWQLGRAGIDDGVLLTIARHERTLRIGVGSGLESSLDSELRAEIISDVMSPAFKRGRYYEGLDRALDQILTHVAGAGLPPPHRTHGT